MSSQIGTDIPSSDPSSWVVQKYGGTSIGKYAGSIAAIVRSDFAHHRVAVVCSARSSGLKSEGTTNKLLQVAAEAGKGDFVAARSTIDSVRDDHSKAARTDIISPVILKDLELCFQKIFQELLTLLRAASTLGEISSRTLDMIVSMGEILSCQFLTAILQDRGINAQFVDLSSIKPIKAHHVADDTVYTSYLPAIRHTILACGSYTPVITGSFGPLPGGLLGQVGRGYTDLCAALVAISLTASELQIWKEVDGVSSADPRKVPTARLLRTITPSEAAELTFYGSEVIHPLTMRQVIHERIPIRIRNVNNPCGAGTTILPEPLGRSSTSGKFDPALKQVTLKPLKPFHPPSGGPLKCPTAITTKTNILIVNVHSNKQYNSYGFFAHVFAILDKCRLSVDLISSSHVHVSMALHVERALFCDDDRDGSKIRHADLQEALSELSQIGDVELADRRAIVSLVGQELKNMVGVSGEMLKVLGENRINVDMISQGATEINISCVVDERQADRAMGVIHARLFDFFS